MLMFLVGAGNAGLQLVRMICLSNVVDEEWLEKGCRREGAYIGTMIFFERLMYIVQGWLLALLLNAFGYVPNVPQKPPVAFGIRVSVTLIPLATLLFLLVSMTFYPIGRRGEQLIAAKRKGVEG